MMPRMISEDPPETVSARLHRIVVVPALRHLGTLRVDRRRRPEELERQLAELTFISL